MSAVPGRGSEAARGRLAGKAALITGAGSGVGRAIALAFAREGARVALMGRRREPLEAVAAEARAAGGEAAVFPGDVVRDHDGRRAIAGTLEAFGRLDTLVNNAGRYVPAPLLETEPEEWRRTLAANLDGPFLLARAAFPALERARGSLVNVSSTVALRPVPGAAAYAVSKAALDMLTRALALEWAPRGVRANGLLLGIVDTPIHSARAVGDLDAWKKAAAALHPLGRIGEPRDAAEAALYLASDEASWTTGALLVVDGGIALA